MCVYWNIKTQALQEIKLLTFPESEKLFAAAIYKLFMGLKICLLFHILCWLTSLSDMISEVTKTNLVFFHWMPSLELGVAEKRVF